MAEVSLTASQYAARVQQLRDQINEALGVLVKEKEPSALYEPVRYVLDGGGKRFRPMLLLLTAEAYGRPMKEAMPAALAVEVFHNFTLVHDDIMDNAESRRGRPTVHVAWDESTAILCGDYLMALAYDQLARTPTRHLEQMLHIFHRMVVRLCEGQSLDKVFESRADVSVQEYLEMVDRKTGALLEASLELGGVLGGAGADDRTLLRSIANAAGRAFQIQDDLLDLVADDDRWGKVIGSDLMEGKKTYLLLRALERAEADEHAWLHHIVDDRGLPQDLVPEARARMERLGVLEDARAAIRRLSSRARTQLAALRGSAATDTLRWLLGRMEARLH